MKGLVASVVIACLCATWCVEAKNIKDQERLRYINELKERLRVNKMSRISGGVDATAGEFPHHATISTLYDTVPHCQGTLVTCRHIVTAAHCMQDGLPDTMKRVALGSLNFLNVNDHTFVNVQKVEIHPDFDMSNHENDIAVITLANPAPCNANIKTAVLPTGPTECIGNDAIVTGFGETSYHGALSHTLKKALLDITDRDVCGNKMGVTISDSNICAGKPGGVVDACLKDGGAPLVLMSAPQDFKLIGLVSAGRHCGKAGIPGVYTNVCKHLVWIKSKIGTPEASCCP